MLFFGFQGRISPTCSIQVADIIFIHEVFRSFLVTIKKSSYTRGKLTVLSPMIYEYAQYFDHES